MFTNPLIKVLWSFVGMKFSRSRRDIDMRRITRGKSLSLAMPKAPQTRSLKGLIFIYSHDMCYSWSVLWIFIFFACWYFTIIISWSHFIGRNTYCSWIYRMLYALHLYLLSCGIYTIVHLFQLYMLEHCQKKHAFIERIVTLAYLILPPFQNMWLNFVLTLYES